jgi:hypothetical protein
MQVMTALLLWDYQAGLLQRGIGTVGEQPYGLFLQTQWAVNAACFPLPYMQLFMAYAC